MKKTNAQCISFRPVHCAWWNSNDKRIIKTNSEVTRPRNCECVFPSSSNTHGDDSTWLRPQGVAIKRDGGTTFTQLLAKVICSTTLMEFASFMPTFDTSVQKCRIQLRNAQNSLASEAPPQTPRKKLDYYATQGHDLPTCAFDSHTFVLLSCQRSRTPAVCRELNAPFYDSTFPTYSMAHNGRVSPSATAAGQRFLVTLTARLINLHKVSMLIKNRFVQSRALLRAASHWLSAESLHLNVRVNS